MGAFDIQGINCVFQLKIGDDYKTAVCAKSFTFNPVTDMKETTTVGSGFWKEFRPRKLSYTITFNGMYQVESLSSQEKIKTMFDYQIGFLPLPYRIIYTDNSGNVMVVEGWVYVTSTLLDASPANLVNGTIELQGNGMPVISDVVPDLANINIVSLGDNSISAVFQFKLFDSAGAVVLDSGQLPSASGGNLTHPVNVTGAIQKGTYSIFWQADATSIGNAFQLDAPPTKSEIFNSGLVNESTFGVQDFDFTANRLVSFTLGTPTPPPACVAPTIASGGSFPDGQVGTAYSSSIVVNGSQPFNITNVTKPTWLTIAITGGDTILLSGIPDVNGTGITVSFDINNACGTASVSDTIDIADAPITISYVSWAYDKSGVGVLRIYVNSVMIIERTSDDASSFSVNPGDVVEVQVLGIDIGAPIKKLKVVNYTDSAVLFDEDGTITQKDFSWTIDAAKFYTVEASNHH
jgi:hypothetical protein